MNGLYQKFRQKALNPIANLFVTNAVDNGSGLIRITTSRSHCLTTSDVVAVLGVGGVSNATGVWTVTVIDSDEFDLQGSTFAGTFTSGGNVLLQDSLLKKLSYLVRWGLGSSGENYGDDIKGVFVNVSGTGTLYTPDLAQHEFLSDIASGARLATSSVLANKTNSTGSGASLVGGVADADDVVFSLVGPSGTTIEAFVLYKDTGNDATSPLIMYVDVATGLPVTANGGNITVSFDTGVNRIFSL